MDLRTIIFLLILTGLFCSLLFFIAGSRSKGRVREQWPPAFFWGAGIFLSMCGFALSATQGKSPPWIGIILTNAMMLLGHIGIILGIRRLVGLALRLRFCLAAWLVVMASIFAFTFIWPSTPARVVMFSLAIAGIHSEVLVHCFGMRRKIGGLLPYATSMMFLLFGLFFLARAVITVFHPIDSIFAANAMNSVTFIVSHVGLLSWSFGLSLLQSRWTEKELETVLDGKVVLLRELQHRVKNSLGVVTGLIGLESERMEDPRHAAVLKGLEGRVASIAELYDRLNRTGESETVELDEYLQSVANTVFTAYAARDRGISLELSMEPVRLDVKRAVSVGLITNELITDCLKYAFPRQGRGAVKLALASEAAGLVLVVSDDGVGLPEGFGIEESKGFGMVIVDMLAKQIGGSFSFVPSDGGARFMVRFPLDQTA